MSWLNLLLSRSFVVFAFIGIANTVLHGGLLVWLVEWVGLRPTFANVLAFGVANLFSFFANCRLTFSMAPTFARYVRFVLASLVSLVLTLSISAVAEWQKLHYLAGFALIVLLVPSISYTLMKLWAFSGRVQQSG